MLIAIFDLIRRGLRRLGPLGAGLALLFGVYAETPVAERAALAKARAVISVVINTEEKSFRRLEHIQASASATPSPIQAKKTKK